MPILFKEISSDDSSVMSWDNSDIGEDYCPLVNNPVIVESSSDFNYNDFKILN